MPTSDNDATGSARHSSKPSSSWGWTGPGTKHGPGKPLQTSSAVEGPTVSPRAGKQLRGRDRRRKITSFPGKLVFPDDQEPRTAIKNADSPVWSIRAAAGRRLAMSGKLEEPADVIQRLLLDDQDTAVTGETAEALLARKDNI
ncbi:hypothetical protein ACIGQE_31155 [Streptomyces sp. NPDC053429]|uniref:hypothetical protein n=1 Tax=Streptomyces sp. NPDC053429 TaxID=3365702 RepID=UPI0037D8615F